ncbi:GNAT family N-acetyltransferase [Aquabacter cavernae]|uniref:GNAT family N-acetyltransferase n=1 Tax=Aquabacter cavernae TaxID=2496029 RepID=UPI000F8F05C7|nr:GNAT family N-acetyltransferase [Aquabacter cavernae]
MDAPALRLATPADLAAVEALVRAAYAPYIPRIGRPPGPMGDDYAALIAAGQVHVAERAGQVDGVLVLLPEADGLLLDNVAVAPRAQGQGLGRVLLAFAEETARAAGHAAIRLYTNAAMAENIALYARLGYAETHRADEAGFRRVYMSKRLPPSDGDTP